ncbi:hypothetical protein ACS0TY_007060 [Phlomoides rotata]
MPVICTAWPAMSEPTPNTQQTQDQHPTNIRTTPKPNKTQAKPDATEKQKSEERTAKKSPAQKANTPKLGENELTAAMDSEGLCVKLATRMEIVRDSVQMPTKHVRDSG